MPRPRVEEQQPAAEAKAEIPAQADVQPDESGAVSDTRIS
jgi:hypothetical protein